MVQADIFFQRASKLYRKVPLAKRRPKPSARPIKRLSAWHIACVVGDPWSKTQCELPGNCIVCADDVRILTC
jgi:hypothetical protein